jgi:hypothetical protein
MHFLTLSSCEPPTNKVKRKLNIVLEKKKFWLKRKQSLDLKSDRLQSTYEWESVDTLGNNYDDFTDAPGPSKKKFRNSIDIESKKTRKNELEEK